MKERVDYRSVAPGAYRAMAQLQGYVAKSGLEPSLVHLVDVRSSQLNGCAF